jgi:hypothetical protein
LKIFKYATERVPNQILHGSDIGGFRDIREYSLKPIIQLDDPELEEKILSENPLQIFGENFIEILRSWNEKKMSIPI